MLRQGLETIDKLEEAKGQEQLEVQSSQTQSQPWQSIDFGLSNPFDFLEFATPSEQVVRVPKSQTLLGRDNETLLTFLDSLSFE